MSDPSMEREYYNAEMRSIKRSKRLGCLATGLIVFAVLVGGAFAAVRFGPRLAARAIFSDEMSWTSDDREREEVRQEINEAIDSLSEYGISRNELRSIVMDIEPGELSSYVRDLQNGQPAGGKDLLIPAANYVDLSGVDTEAIAAELDKRVNFDELNTKLKEFDDGEMYAFRFVVPMAKEALLEILEHSD